MSSTLVGPEIEAPPEAGGGRGGFENVSGGDDGPHGSGPARRYDLYQTAVWVLLVPVVMLFFGLTSALVIRRGISDDWVPTRIPPLLTLNTIALVASSIALERARRFMKRGDWRSFRSWLLGTTGLGALFLAGQVVAWKQLAAQGVFVSTNPSSSFFYVLTATHGAHLVGGMTALLYLTVRMLQSRFGTRRQAALKAAAVYWHFMDALWIYVLFVLLFWR